MSLALLRVQQQNVTALKEGMRIVQRVMGSPRSARPSGWTTKELYEAAVKVPTTDRFRKDFAYEEPVPQAPQYTSSGKLRPERPRPSHPEHPVRSLRFLKENILANLERERLIKKAVIKRVIERQEASPSIQKQVSKQKGKKTGTSANTVASASADVQPAATTVVEQSVWAWKPLSSPISPKPRPRKNRMIGYGHPLGKGWDWSHLSKRRRRARIVKVLRDVKKVRAMEARDDEKSGSQTGRATRLAKRSLEGKKSAKTQERTTLRH